MIGLHYQVAKEGYNRFTYVPFKSIIKNVKDIFVFLGLKMFNYDKFYLYCHAAEIA